jgi:hypothetical protein
MPAERERWLPRKELAAIISERVRPISHRSLERWPIRAKRIGRKAHHELNEVLARAQREIEDAPTVMQSVRRPMLAKHREQGTAHSRSVDGRVGESRR